jgi:hypothetical protein
LPMAGGCLVAFCRGSNKPDPVLSGGTFEQGGEKRSMVMQP